MIDYLRNLFISWFNKILNWFSERQKKEMNTKKEIPFDKNKHADDNRQERISEGFKALDDGCKSIADLRAEIEMSQTNNDLDAPVPANKKIPLRDGDKVSFRIGVSTRDGFINPNHNVLNAERQKKDPIEVNNKNISEVYEMSCFGSKPEKKRAQLKVVNAGSMEIKNKMIPSYISNISMRSNSDNNSINEYKPFLEKPARSNNAKFNEIDKQFQQMENKLAESTNDMNKLKEQVNKNTEDIKKNTEDIKKTQEEQIDIKKMIAEMKEENKDSKIRIANSERMLEKMEEDRKNQEKKYEEDKKKSEENQKAHDEVMRYLWDKLDEWNGIKQPTREGSDNRESTNTSFSSFKYKNPFRNNARQPKMERADMAHSYDEN